MEASEKLLANSETVFKGIECDIVHEVKELSNNSFIKTEKILLKKRVTIIPITQKEKIVLLKKKLIDEDYYSYSLPTGLCTQNDNIIENARRILLKETGYESTRFKTWMKYDDQIYYIKTNEILVIANNCKYLLGKHLDKEWQTLEVTYDELKDYSLRRTFKNVAIQLELLKALAVSEIDVILKKELFYDGI